MATTKSTAGWAEFWDLVKHEQVDRLDFDKIANLWKTTKDHAAAIVAMKQIAAASAALSQANQALDKLAAMGHDITMPRKYLGGTKAKRLRLASDHVARIAWPEFDR